MFQLCSTRLCMSLIRTENILWQYLLLLLLNSMDNSSSQSQIYYSNL